MSTKRPYYPCENCRFRKFAGDDPLSLLGEFWTWHTKWCPGWKKYLRTLREYGENPPSAGHLRGFWDESERDG